MNKRIKVKSLPWNDVSDEHGWGILTPKATGILYDYKITGESGNLKVTATPLVKDIFSKHKEKQQDGFDTREEAEFWANIHNQSLILDWIE